MPCRLCGGQRATGKAIATGEVLRAGLWAVCTVGMIAIILVTVVVLGPLNATLAESDPGAQEPKAHRRTAARWDVLHRGCTLALGIVLLLEVTATRL